MPKKSSTAALRKDYNEAKRVYHSLGRKAMGKSDSSPVKKDYKTAKAVYKKIGKQLGKATGMRARKGR
jgi:hypothetical protein